MKLFSLFPRKKWQDSTCYGFMDGNCKQWPVYEYIEFWSTPENQEPANGADGSKGEDGKNYSL